jgi:hypothetical protein
MELIDHTREKYYRNIRDYIGIYIDPNLYKRVFSDNFVEIDDKDLDYFVYKYSNNQTDNNEKFLNAYRSISDHIEVLYRKKDITKAENNSLIDLLHRYCFN